MSGGEGRAVAIGGAGQAVYVAGGDGADALVVAYDVATGAQLWRTVWAGPVGERDWLEALAVAPDGSRVYATGFANDPVGSSKNLVDLVLLALDAATGQVLWQALPDPLALEDRGFVLAASPDGSRVYVAGETKSGSSSSSLTDLVTAAYDAASGAQLWLDTFDSGGPFQGERMETPVGIAVSPDGLRVHVGSRAEKPLCCSNEDHDWAAVAYDAAAGTVLWSERFNAGDEDIAEAMALSPDGSRVYLAGTAASQFFFAAAAYDAATGAFLWQSLQPKGTGSRARELAVHPDGRTLYLAGRFKTDDWSLLALDGSTGEPFWSAEYDGPQGGESLAGIALAADAGRLYAAGGTFPQGANLDVTVVAYELPTLLGTLAPVSLGAGGTQAFELRAGGSSGGQLHLLLGSLSGTAPGVFLDGQNLPLNPDPYLLLLAADPVAGLIPGALGTLDPQGNASLALTLPPGTNPALAGLTAHHAYLTIWGLAVTHASNPVALELLP